MKSLITILLLSAFSCLFVRCTIEKRLYNRGFHVEWNKKIHIEKEVVKEEPKKEIEQTQFAASTFTKTDSVIETHESVRISEDSSQLASNMHQVFGNETKKDTYSPYHKQSRTKALKEEESSDETKEPINRKALIFALVFTAVIIGLIVLLAILVPSISAELITLGIIVISFGTAIFFQVFNRKTKAEENSKENTKPIEEKPISSDDWMKFEDSEKTLARKKGNAVTLTIIGFFALGLGFLALFGASTALEFGSAILLFLGALALGFAALLILLTAVGVWDDYHDSKKEAETSESEPDKPPRPKVKGRGWILLGILVSSVFAVVIDYFRTN